jgi:hypothetical protein
MTSSHINTIAILGRGSVGEALAKGWRRSGRQVLFGVRSPGDDDERLPADASAAADAIVLAVPFAAVEAVCAEIAAAAAGKLVIDCTNPLAMRDGRLSLSRGFETSGGEFVAERLPHARVVKTLNQTGAENMADARAFPAPPVMFIAGADADIAAAAPLVADLGFEPVAAGPLVNARLLEPLAMLWIDQALVRGAGRTFAFARVQAQA